jgi:hypothetical protein
VAEGCCLHCVDGIDHCDEQALDMLATISLFQEDVRLDVDSVGRYTTAHLVSHEPGDYPLFCSAEILT